MSEKAISFTKSLAAAINCSADNTIVSPLTKMTYEILMDSENKNIAYSTLMNIPGMPVIGIRLEVLIDDWFEREYFKLKRPDAFKVIDRVIRRSS